MASKRPSRWRSTGTGLAVGAVLGFLMRELDLPTLVSYWHDRAPLVAVVALVGAGVWNTRLRWLVGTAAAGLGLVWLLVAFTPLCNWLARDLPRRDTLQPADAVYVLGSDMQMDGELTTEAMSRLIHALEILGQGFAPRLIVPELPSPIPSYAGASKKLMQNLGMTQEVLSVGPVRRTRDEAVQVGALFRERGWKRLLVVTSPAHSRRASAAMENEDLDVVSSPSMQTRFDLENLDLPDDRILGFGTLIHEKVGLWVYERSGWIGRATE